MHYFILFIMFSSQVSFAQDYSFLGLTFNMTEEEVYNILKDSKYLIPAEDRLLRQLIPPTPYTIVLKASNYDNNQNMIQKIFIDFNEKTSYQITIFLHPKYFSFYTLSEKMLDSYGVPKSRNSKQVLWFNETEQYRVSLEFPATIKYTDMTRFIDVLRMQEQDLETQQSESFDYKEKQFILDEL